MVSIKKAIIYIGILHCVILTLIMYTMILLYPKLFNEIIGIVLASMLCLAILSTMIFAVSIILVLIFAPDILRGEW